MGHEDQARPARREYPEKLVLEPPSKRGVEGREWLVHQEEIGVADEGASEGDPLGEASRKLGGIGAAEIREAEELDDFADPPGALTLRIPRSQA